MKTLFLRQTLGACLCIFFNAFALAGADPHGHSEAEQERVVIAPELAQQLGLISTQARSARVRPASQLLGQLQLDPRYFYYPSSRFAGLISQLKVAQGDWVEAGQLLANVQALDGQRSYELRASQAGRVLQQLGYQGQIAQPENPLLVIADDRRWQLQIPLFEPSQKATPGQALQLQLGDQLLELTIANLSPASSGQMPPGANINSGNSAASWLALANLQLGHEQARLLAPGQWLMLQLLQPEVELPLAVASKALQTVEGQQGVFVQEEDAFEFHPLQLGRRLGDQVEVLAGLEPGVSYLLENAYLLKAELEKAGAGHEH